MFSTIFTDKRSHYIIRVLSCPDVYLPLINAERDDFSASWQPAKERRSTAANAKRNKKRGQEQ